MNEEDAVSLKHDLMRRYATAKVIEFAGPTGHWVRINPKYPDKETAAKVAESIHVPDAEPYLIRTD
jgi:rare lipoprotein A